MSLPNNRLTTTCVENDFLDPDSIIRATRTVDYERGGVALQDSSQGLRVKNWVIEIVGDDVTVYPQDDALDVVTIFSEAGITEVSLAFDQNMQPVVGYIVAGVAKLRWYSAGTSAYVTTELSASSRSIFLTMDDKRKAATEGNRNDVLVFYLRDDGLLYRQQRDLYAIERSLYTFNGTNDTFIRRVGFLSGYRVGVELYDLPGLPGCISPPAISGLSPLTGLSVTVQQESIDNANPTKTLSGIAATVSLGQTGFDLVTVDKIVALTGRSVTVSRGSLTVPPYPNLLSTKTPNFVVTSAVLAQLTVTFATNGTWTAIDGEGATRLSGTWIDTSQTNYAITDIASQYRVVSVTVFVGYAPYYTHPVPPSTLSSSFSFFAQNLQSFSTVNFDFQITIAPTTTNPRYGELSYSCTHRITVAIELQGANPNLP